MVQFSIAAAAVMLSSVAAVAAAEPSSGGLRRVATTVSEESPSTLATTRDLMEMDHFMPLPCNANLTVDDCDGSLLLSSIVADATQAAGEAMSATNATSYPQGMEATIPCGVCAIADITDGSTLVAPTGIDVQGMLYFPPSSHGKLEAAHIFVQGVFKIDPPVNPVLSDTGLDAERGRLTIKLIGPDEDVFITPHPDNAMACASYSNGTCPVGKRPIAVAGGRLDVRGRDYDDALPNCPSWVHLQDMWGITGSRTALKVGTDAANCWKNLGDILITNYNPGLKELDNQKVLTLSSVDPINGTVIVNVHRDVLGDPFTVANEPTMPAEVASLNRPVVFDSVRDGPKQYECSTCPRKHGGHLIIFHTPNVAQKIEGVEITSFGQRGNLGRYPIHFHHSQHATGSVIRKNVVRTSNQRCVVIHGTNSVMIENNVAYDTQGMCFVTEDGSETDNTFKDNLGAKTDRGTDIGGQPEVLCSTYWIRNVENHFIGNVAAGSRIFGFWVDAPVSRAGPIYTFRDNTAHNNERMGITLYSHGYKATSAAYFDGSRIYNNAGGLKVKRTKNIKIRNSFFANNNLAIENFRNNGYVQIENTTFYAAPPRHANTMCPNRHTGIASSYESSTIQIRIKDSSFIGYSNPSCAAPGLALKISNPLGTAVSYGTLPRLERVTFDPPTKSSSFGILSDSVLNSIDIILEDPDGSIAGEQGFFVQNNSLGHFSQNLCSLTEGMYETMFCAGVCHRSVSVETFVGNSSSVKLVVASRSDPSILHQYEGSSSTVDPAYNLNIDLGFMPLDEYDLGFVDSQTGEPVNLPSTVALGAGQAFCTGTEDIAESNFIFPSVPSGSIHLRSVGDFHLYKRINATDLAAQSGLVVNGDSLENFDTGDWATYTDLWFGAAGDTTRIRLRFSALNQGGKIEARLGGVYGEVIGLFHPWNTHGQYVDAAFDVDASVEGLHQLTFTGTDSSDMMSFSWFELGLDCFATGFICIDDGDCCSNSCGTNGFCEQPPPSTYYIGYKNRACSGRNELGDSTKSTVEECAAACDTEPACVSFEYMPSLRCQLSSSCSYDLTEPYNNYNYYIKVPDGVASHGNPEGDFYLWLLENAAETSPIELALASSVELPLSTNYYVGYANGGCAGMNELGVSTVTSVHECASACDAESTCVSFEYRKGTSDITNCHLSSSCDHYSLKANNPDNAFMWYLKTLNGMHTHTVQGGNAYLWLMNDIVPTNIPSASPSATTSPSTSIRPATYYIGYNTGGCSGRNELGLSSKPVVEECARSCDSNPTCASFEYKKSGNYCILSTSCDDFSLTANQPGISYSWYLKVTDDAIRSRNPVGNSYLWLLDNLGQGAVVPPSGLTTTNYYTGYNTGGCAGRNELGLHYKSTVEDCAAACDAELTCVSFEYRRSKTDCMLSTSCDDFSLTVNLPGNAYQWYQRSNGYTTHEQTGGNAYLWLIN